ncbi:MAG: Ca-activated chloride channel [Acidobacteriota bacterium]|jgi:Ca-activated chloride channel family protein|nr:Ca-activated chloride channel [Acidobacteriota bacterium]
MSKERWKLTSARCPALYCGLALLYIFLLVPIQAQQPQDDDVLRVNTDLVVVNVTVTDASGKYARGLRRADFKLMEDGKDQVISNFSAEETPFAAVVLLDFSGSMENRMPLARSAAIHFLDGLRDEDVAAVYSFDSEIEQLQDFSPSRDLAPIAFARHAKGMTVLNDAILRAAEELSHRPEKRRAIVVLSDGYDTKSSASMEKAMAAALNSGVTIYTVDMSSTDTNLQARAQAAGALRGFASKSGGRYIATPGGQAMREAFAGIVEELGNQYTIAYQPSNHARDGHWREIDVKLARSELTVRARKGYRAPKN